MLNLAERLDEDLVPLLYAAAGRTSEEIARRMACEKTMSDGTTMGRCQ